MTAAAQRALAPLRDEREMLALRALSARVGANPLLVQASNGNTSIKLEEIMWIKASGRLLADAGRDELFVGVELAGAGLGGGQIRDDCSENGDSTGSCSGDGGVDRIR